MQAKRQLAAPSDFDAATNQAQENFARKAQEIFFLTVLDEFEEYQNQHTIDGNLAVTVGALDDRLDSERVKRRLRGLRATFQALVDLASANPGRVGTTVGPEYQTPAEWAIERAQAALREAIPDHRNRRKVSDWLASHPMSEVGTLESMQEVGVYCTIARRLLAPFGVFVKEQLQRVTKSIRSHQQATHADRARASSERAVMSHPMHRPVDARKELIASLRARHPGALASKICELIDRSIKATPIKQAALAPLESWLRQAPGKRSWVEVLRHAKTHNLVRSYVNKVPPLRTGKSSR